MTILVSELPTPCFIGNVVWLDDNTSIRALINSSQMPDPLDVNKQTESISQSADEGKGLCVYVRSLKKILFFFFATYR